MFPRTDTHYDYQNHILVPPGVTEHVNVKMKGLLVLVVPADDRIANHTLYVILIFLLSNHHSLDFSESADL
jgi:hypothetical protein